jgi:hypothetical protein
MKSISEYLDLAKKQTGSDYATAQTLGVDRAAISMMRKNGKIGDENAVKLAELTGIDAGEILLAAAMARSQGAVKTAWESVGKRAGIAAALVVMAALPPAAKSLEMDSESENVYYVK